MGSQLTIQDIWTEGRKLSPITLTRVDPTTINVGWKIPDPSNIYAGAIVLISTEKFGPNNFPVDGQKYLASNNLQAPADTIGNAQVVFAQYSYFGDDISQNTVTISNADPDTVYFASVHISTESLQYFSTGVQNYALDSGKYTSMADTYTGNIPQSERPPANPTNGQVYFDKSVMKVFVWNQDLSSWLEASHRTVPTGVRPPLENNSIFYSSSSNTLNVFMSGMWVECTPANTQVKFGGGWIPLGNATWGGDLPETPNPGDLHFITFKAPMGGVKHSAVKIYTMGQWINLVPDLVQVETFPGTWSGVIIGENLYGDFLPNIPSIGEFFYKTSTRDLLTWSGSDWVKANSEQEGKPTTEKTYIGTDGSGQAHIELTNTIKSMLGWPQVCVELKENNFDAALDSAIAQFRARADNAYKHQYISMSIIRGQDRYYLNDPRVGTDRIVDVMKIHRVNMLGVSTITLENGIYAQAFFNQFFSGQFVDLTALHLVHQMGETFEKIFAGNIMFSWDEVSRELVLFRNINLHEEKILLEVSVERTEQELIKDRWAGQWIKNWALAEAKRTLGNIRSKFGTIAGANGGITLNGDQLLADAMTDFEELRRQLLDYEVGNGGITFGNTSFLIG